MLDGKEYLTYIDENGIQMFPEDPEHFLAKQTSIFGGPYDLNEMALRYHNGEFSQRDYAEMNMAVGHSVSGFADISDFHDMQLINPLWNVKQPDDTYLSGCLRSGKKTTDEVIGEIMKRDNITKKEAIGYYLEFLDPER